MSNNINFCDERIYKLRQKRNYELCKFNEEKFIKMVRCYIAYYGTSQKVLAELLHINPSTLNKVLNNKQNSVGKNQWDLTIAQLMKLDLIGMFEDMATEYNIDPKVKKILDNIQSQILYLTNYKNNYNKERHIN